MDNAFEDQLVQKVMPKLRGLETRGTQKEVLDAIDGIIGTRASDEFHSDFKNATEQNYGQFIWCTSDYLLRGDSADEKKAKEADAVAESSLKKSPEPDFEAIKKAVKKHLDAGVIKDDAANIPDYLKKKFHIEDKKERNEIFKKLKRELKF